MAKESDVTRACGSLHLGSRNGGEMNFENPEEDYWKRRALKAEAKVERLTNEVWRLRQIEEQHEAQVASLSEYRDKFEMLTSEMSTLEGELESARAEIESLKSWYTNEGSKHQVMQERVRGLSEALRNLIAANAGGYVEDLVNARRDARLALEKWGEKE